MKIKLEKFGGFNHLRIIDNIEFPEKNQKIDLKIDFNDIEFNLKPRQSKNKIRERTVKKSFIKIVKKPEYKIEYITLNKCKSKAEIINFKFLDYEIEFFIDKSHIIEKLKNRILFINDINESFKKILDYIKNYLTIERIDISIQQVKAIILFWISSGNSEKIIEFINNLSQLGQIKNLEEISINTRFDNTRHIELRFKQNFLLNEKYYEILKLFDEEIVNSICINNCNCRINSDIINSKILFENLKLVKKILKFKKTNIFKFFKEIDNLNFLNNVSSLEKFLIIFHKLEKKLNNLNNSIQLFYL